ncbi:hypothetical protein ABZY16_36825 [Streptomyces sp. NPDC006553]|uniref:hypothetical protein n=1 Tax=unclassified Streptomyces TaxID=2593676 RepID=UPI002255ADB2|nr:hypothetical protein [Streptomyces sp. NBC_00233]MCX5232154.1 hypothetical protein [Streptomyces sp. NBC_00233]
MVLHGPHPPVEDLLAGQVLKDKPLLLGDVFDDRIGRGDRTGGGRYDRRRRDQDVGGQPRGCGFPP